MSERLKHCAVVPAFYLLSGLWLVIVTANQALSMSWIKPDRSASAEENAALKHYDAKRIVWLDQAKSNISMDAEVWQMLDFVGEETFNPSRTEENFSDPADRLPRALSHEVYGFTYAAIELGGWKQPGELKKYQRVVRRWIGKKSATWFALQAGLCYQHEDFACAEKQMQLALKAPLETPVSVKLRGMGERFLRYVNLANAPKLLKSAQPFRGPSDALFAAMLVAPTAKPEAFLLLSLGAHIDCDEPMSPHARRGFPGPSGQPLPGRVERPQHCAYYDQLVERVNRETSAQLFWGDTPQSTDADETLRQDFSRELERCEDTSVLETLLSLAKLRDPRAAMRAQIAKWQTRVCP